MSDQPDVKDLCNNLYTKCLTNLKEVIDIIEQLQSALCCEQNNENRTKERKNT